ncbi:MAG: site-specific integrase [Cytophagales bacterium]|nr:site-specific integrase [Cytophagales bacterium]
MNIKVTLRKKKISKGRESLYLDYYPPITHPKTNKPTRREFLKMYVFENPKGQNEHTHNKETLKLAELICQKQENRLNKPEIYTDFEKQQIKKKEIGEQSFLDYYDKQCKKRKGDTNRSWLVSKKFLIAYNGGEHLPFSNLTVLYCNDYADFLLNTTGLKKTKQKLSPNTAHGYFVKLKAVLRQAFKDNLLDIDLSNQLNNISTIETKKEFLTLDELNKLIETKCEDPVLKKVALFSSLTGLRVSDIKKLTWEEVEEVNPNEYCLRFQQKKTKGLETLPISNQALELMGTPSNNSSLVFSDFEYSSYKNKLLAKWIKDAGITKKITFHCFRHTFATLQLTHGTDLYTVSKMLGHKNITTTQVYAKIVDEKKREAANKIKLNL